MSSEHDQLEVLLVPRDAVAIKISPTHAGRPDVRRLIVVGASISLQTSARSGLVTYAIMDAVAHGETFIVTRNGAPIGELIPLRRYRRVLREQFAAGSANAPIDAARFRADVDRAVDDQLRDPYER